MFTNPFSAVFRTPAEHRSEKFRRHFVLSSLSALESDSSLGTTIIWKATRNLGLASECRAEDRVTLGALRALAQQLFVPAENERFVLANGGTGVSFVHMDIGWSMVVADTEAYEAVMGDEIDDFVEILLAGTRSRRRH